MFRVFTPGLDPAKQVAPGKAFDVTATNDQPGGGTEEESLANRLLEEALREKLQVEKKTSDAPRRADSGGGTEIVSLLELLMKALGGSGSGGEGKVCMCGRVRVRVSVCMAGR